MKLIDLDKTSPLHFGNNFKKIQVKKVNHIEGMTGKVLFPDKVAKAKEVISKINTDDLRKLINCSK